MCIEEKGYLWIVYQTAYRLFTLIVAICATCTQSLQSHILYKKTGMDYQYSFSFIVSKLTPAAIFQEFMKFSFHDIASEIAHFHEPLPYCSFDRIRLLHDMRMRCYIKFNITCFYCIQTMRHHSNAISLVLLKSQGLQTGGIHQFGLNCRHER